MAIQLPPIHTEDRSFFFFLFLILSRKRGHFIDHRLANWHHSRLPHHHGVYDDRLHDDLWHHDNLRLHGHIHWHHGLHGKHGHVCRLMHCHIVRHLDVSLVDFLLQLFHLRLLLPDLLQLLKFRLLIRRLIVQMLLVLLHLFQFLPFIL